jgi:Fe-S-cluster containining protein
MSIKCTLKLQVMMNIKASKMLHRSEMKEMFDNVEKRIKSRTSILKKTPPDEWFPSLHNQMMMAIDRSFLIDKPNISCKAGCNHCCKQHIVTCLRETRLIYKYVKDNNIQIDQERLNKQMAFERKYGKYTNDLVNDWWGKFEDNQCVFAKDGNCLIYPVRPLSCRAHYSVGDPVECGKLRGHFECMVIEEAEEIISAMMLTNRVNGLATCLGMITEVMEG